MRKGTSQRYSFSHHRQIPKTYLSTALNSIRDIVQNKTSRKRFLQSFIFIYDSQKNPASKLWGKRKTLHSFEHRNDTKHERIAQPPLPPNHIMVRP